MPLRESLHAARRAARTTTWPLRAQFARRDASISARARVRDPRFVDIGPDVLIGSGADLWAFCAAPDGGPGIILRRRADIRDYALLHAYGGCIEVGVFSCVNHFCFVNGAGGVHIGDDVMIGTGTAILSSEHGLELSGVPMTRQSIRVAPVIIESNVYVGANVTIQSGVRIGTGAIIGSGAVVRDDVPPRTLAAGVPARVIRQR
jgi:acetyltransferase-like isoleucine patch superfamily enzyme